MSSNKSDLEPIIFEDLDPISIPVTIKGTSYILKEASEGAAIKYRNATLKAAQIGEGGRVTSMEGLADAEPLLVSLCLFEVTPQGEKSVSLQTILSWPSRIVNPLFERIMRISHLERDSSQKKELRNGQEEPS